MSKQKENTEDITGDYKKISAAFLTKHGYFNGNYIGSLIWTINNVAVDSVEIRSDTLFAERPFIQLVYSQKTPDSEEITNYNYKIYLEKVYSNIFPDKYFYYFTCPLTGKRTSVLYKSPSGNMFLHHDAHQVFSGNNLITASFRNLENRFGLELEYKIIKLKSKLQEKLKSNHKKVPLKLIERVRELEARVNKLYVVTDFEDDD